MDGFDQVLAMLDEEDDGEMPVSDLGAALLATRPAAEAPQDKTPGTGAGMVEALGVDVTTLTPADLQTIALRNLVQGSMRGDVQASKALMAFTEDVDADANADLRAMTPGQLIRECEVLIEGFRSLEMREVASQ